MANAVGDVYFAKIIVETREKTSSIGFHYLMTDPATLGQDTSRLAFSVQSVIFPLLAACLSNKVHLRAVAVNRLHTVGGFKARSQPATDAVPGEVSSDALPAVNSMRIKLHQAVFSPQSDGEVHLPGIPESVVSGNVLQQAFLDAQVAALKAGLVATLPEQGGGGGNWRLSVVSKKYLIDNPGDWPGATADVLTVSVPNRLGSHRGRMEFYKRKKPAVVPPPPE